MYVSFREEGLGIYNSEFSSGGNLPTAAQEQTANGTLTVASIVKRGLILLVIAAVAFALYKYFNKKKRRRNRR